MRLRNLAFVGLTVFALGFALFFYLSPHHRAQRFVSIGAWQHMVSPGELSQAHTFLDNNCAACHTATKSVAAEKCIVCHANNQALLQSEPTAFHADVQSCTSCHLEHNGRSVRPTEMDHSTLVKLGLTSVRRDSSAAADRVRRVNETSAEIPNPHISREEAQLNCAACHSTKDRHRTFFGSDCAQCHATTTWHIAEFRHPPASSQDCAQCHQAPPSHYMHHFHMISMHVAGQEHADVRQCFLCHQTTSWNDIKGVGYYKHH